MMKAIEYFSQTDILCAFVFFLLNLKIWKLELRVPQSSVITVSGTTGEASTRPIHSRSHHMRCEWGSHIVRIKQLQLVYSTYVFSKSVKQRY